MKTLYIFEVDGEDKNKSVALNAKSIPAEYKDDCIFLSVDKEYEEASKYGVRVITLKREKAYHNELFFVYDNIDNFVNQGYTHFFLVQGLCKIGKNFFNKTKPTSLRYKAISLYGGMLDTGLYTFDYLRERVEYINELRTLTTDELFSGKLYRIASPSSTFNSAGSVRKRMEPFKNGYSYIPVYHKEVDITFYKLPKKVEV